VQKASTAFHFTFGGRLRLFFVKQKAGKAFSLAMPLLQNQASQGHPAPW
jgi:hypothetical protein